MRRHPVGECFGQAAQLGPGATVEVARVDVGR
jgi:hypothetical protein